MESGEKREAIEDSPHARETATAILVQPLFALALVLVCFVILQVLEVLFAFLLGPSYALVPAFVVGGILPVLAFTGWFTGSTRSFLRLLPVRPLPLVFCVGASFSFVVLQYTVAGLVEKFFPMPIWMQDFLVELTRVRNLSEFIKVASGVVIAAAVAEELLFRGLLQGSLEKRYGRWPGIVLTSLLFALLHDPWRFLPILFIGGLLGFLVSRGHSVYYGMIAHAVSNATSVAGGNLFGIEGGRQISLPLSFVVLMVAVFLISAAGFVRSTEPQNPPATRPNLGKSPTRMGDNSQRTGSL